MTSTMKPTHVFGTNTTSSNIQQIIHQSKQFLLYPTPIQPPTSNRSSKDGFPQTSASRHLRWLPRAHLHRVPRQHRFLSDARILHTCTQTSHTDHESLRTMEFQYRGPKRILHLFGNRFDHSAFPSDHAVRSRRRHWRHA
jgi:hypothetical protein